MCIFSQPKAPPPVAIPTPPSPTAVTPPSAQPQESDPQVQQQQVEDRQRRLRSAQGNSTLVTGGGGLTDQPSTGLKTAFGA